MPDVNVVEDTLASAVRVSSMPAVPIRVPTTAPANRFCHPETLSITTASVPLTSPDLTASRVKQKWGKIMKMSIGFANKERNSAVSYPPPCQTRRIMSHSFPISFFILPLIISLQSADAIRISALMERRVTTWRAVPLTPASVPRAGKALIATKVCCYFSRSALSNRC